jgi:hypothetical protein
MDGLEWTSEDRESRRTNPHSRDLFTAPRQPVTAPQSQRFTPTASPQQREGATLGSVMTVVASLRALELKSRLRRVVPV